MCAVQEAGRAGAWRKERHGVHVPSWEAYTAAGLRHRCHGQMLGKGEEGGWGCGAGLGHKTGVGLLGHVCGVVCGGEGWWGVVTDKRKNAKLPKW